MVAEALVIVPEVPAVSVKAGWKLLEQLNSRGSLREGFVTAAFWRYHEESRQWRLYIALPMVDSKGKIETYRFIHNAIVALPSNLRDEMLRSGVTAVSPGWELIKQLRSIYGLVDGTRGRRDYVPSLGEDVFIYRL